MGTAVKETFPISYTKAVENRSTVRTCVPKFVKNSTIAVPTEDANDDLYKMKRKTQCIAASNVCAIWTLLIGEVFMLDSHICKV